MTQRMREGSITLDEYDSQSLEVARQEGTVLLMIRIDHLIRDDYVCNPLLDDIVIDFGDDPDFTSIARESDQLNSSDCFTIIVSCGLANFERTSWSTQRCQKFWGSYDELATEADFDKFVDSFCDNYLGVCVCRSIWMTTAESSMIPDCDKSLEGAHLSESEDHEVYHEIQELL